MNQTEQREFNEALIDAAYCAVKFSDLWRLPNREVDAKAEELAAHLKPIVDAWIEAREEELIREAAVRELEAETLMYGEGAA